MALEDQLTKRKDTLILDHKLEIYDQDFFVKFTTTGYQREKMHPDPKVREQERIKSLAKMEEILERQERRERAYQEALKQTIAPEPNFK